MALYVYCLIVFWLVARAVCAAGGGVACESSGGFCNPTQRDCINAREPALKECGGTEVPEVHLKTLAQLPSADNTYECHREFLNASMAVSSRPVNISIIRSPLRSYGVRGYRLDLSVSWDEEYYDPKLTYYSVRLCRKQPRIPFDKFCGITKSARRCVRARGPREAVYQDVAVEEGAIVKVWVVSTPYYYLTPDCSDNSVIFKADSSPSEQLINPEHCGPPINDVILPSAIHSEWIELGSDKTTRLQLTWSPPDGTNRIYFVSLTEPQLGTAPPDCRDHGDNPPCFITDQTTITINGLDSSRGYRVNVDSFTDKCVALTRVEVYKGCGSCCQWKNIPAHRPVNPTATSSPQHGVGSPTSPSARSSSSCVLLPGGSLLVTSSTATLLSDTLSLQPSPLQQQKSASTIRLSATRSLHSPSAGESSSSSQSSSAVLISTVILVILFIAMVTIAVLSIVYILRRKGKYPVNEDGAMAGICSGGQRRGNDQQQNVGFNLHQLAPDAAPRCEVSNHLVSTRRMSGVGVRDLKVAAAPRPPLTSMSVCSSSLTTPSFVMSPTLGECEPPTSSDSCGSLSLSTSSLDPPSDATNFHVLVVYSNRTPENELKEAVLQHLLLELNSYKGITAISPQFDHCSMSSLWLEEKFRKAKVVLCVCNRQFQEEWDGSSAFNDGSSVVSPLCQLLHATLTSEGSNKFSRKFAVVLPKESDRRHIPTLYLHPCRHFLVTEVEKIAHFVKGIPLYSIESEPQGCC